MEGYRGDDGILRLQGHVEAILTRGDKVLDVRRSSNVVTTNGKEFIARFFNSAATAATTFLMRYCGIGTGTTGESSADTALGTQTARVSGNVTYSSSAIYSVVATFASTVGTGSITEYGLFSASANGTMLGRVTSAAVSKGADDILTVTYSITVT